MQPAGRADGGGGADNLPPVLASSNWDGLGCRVYVSVMLFPLPAFVVLASISWTTVADAKIVRTRRAPTRSVCSPQAQPSLHLQVELARL